MQYRGISEDIETIPGLNKSDLTDVFSLVMKCMLYRLASTENILGMKVLLSRTTIVKWWRVPTSDKICLPGFLLG